MPGHAFTTASLSDVGRVRTRNEDACSEFCNEAGLRLLVVADGMGGHRGGETASRVTVETLGEIFQDLHAEPDVFLRDALETANERVFGMSRADSGLRGMGTTAVALLLAPDGRGWVAHVGDSRVYRYRDHHLCPLTSDHSVVGELERRGMITAEQAAVHPRRNEILRSVGVDAGVEVDVAPIDVRVGDRYLLCSDGLSGMVDETEIAVILDEHAPGDAAEALVARANEHGGHDNVTVQVVEIVDASDEARGAEAPTVAAPEAATPAAPAPSPSREAHRHRVRLAMLGAGMLAGLTALALLWWVA